jgi:hypothetical protein
MHRLEYTNLNTANNDYQQATDQKVQQQYKTIEPRGEKLLKCRESLL